MPRNGRTTTRKNYSLPEPTIQDIEQIADEENLSKSMVVEKAVESFKKQLQYGDTDQKIAELHSALVEGDSDVGGLSENSGTHTQTETNTECASNSSSGETPESDGGVAVADSSTGVPQATFDSLEEYSPDYPCDYEISNDALRDAPRAINDGLEINPDHVDYSDLISKGMKVPAKTAVCAAIIRYNYSGGISEEQIKQTASEVLGGKRNAQRHFESVTNYLCEYPSEHPLISEKEIKETPKSLKKRVCAVDGMYAPSAEYVADIYFPFDFSDTIDKLDKHLQGEPSLSSVAPCQGTLDSLHSKPDEYIEYACDDWGDYEETYRKYLRKAIAHQEEAGTDLEFPSPDLNSDESIRTIEEFDQAVEGQ